MIGNGYYRSEYNNCLYHKELFDGYFIYLLLYVDNMLIDNKNMVEISRLKVQFWGEFEIKDLWSMKKILGIKIHRYWEIGKLYLS